MASIKRVQSPRLALLQGRGGVLLSCSHTPSLFADWLKSIYYIIHCIHVIFRHDNISSFHFLLSLLAASAPSPAAVRPLVPVAEEPVTRRLLSYMFAASTTMMTGTCNMTLAQSTTWL